MTQAVVALVGLLALGAGPAKPSPIAEPRFHFDIATASGAATSTWASLAYDREHDELFAVFGGLVHVFNGSGMESYAFGGDGDLGAVERLTLLPGGDLLLLTALEGRRVVLRTDYRGEKLRAVQIDPMPDGFDGFVVERLQVQGDKLYWVQTNPMRVVVTDLNGQLAQAYDLNGLVSARSPEIRLGMSGFHADPQGNMIITLPYAFLAFVVSPAGALKQFGVRGSSPGKFNVVGAVTVDENGYLFVLDRLRSVVMIFDQNQKFVVEFGYRGDGPKNLIAPYDLAVGNGKVFVSQARDRGVKVFSYEVRQPAPAASGPAQRPGAGRG